MGAVLEVLGGLTIIAALAFAGITFATGGAPALLGSTYITLPTFIGGLTLAALGRIVVHLAVIAKATAAQAAAIEELRAKRRKI